PTRYAVCIVDSGLLVTPDTPAESAGGPILERLATDGGSGEPQGTAEEQLHGTRMAMAAVAPVNDWGTIGAATWVRVVSVRAMVAGETTFRDSAYRKGLTLCQNAAGRHPIGAASLSLSCNCDLGADENVLLQDAVGRAHATGISVAAGAGNTSGAPTGAPASYPGVVAVAAGSGSGGLCSYSTFDSRVDVLGPACPVDAGNPVTGMPTYDSFGGSSTATVTAATLLVALRTLRPDATHEQVEAWVRDSARVVDGRRVLDAEAAARSGGLGAVVDRARSRMPSAAPPLTSTSVPDTTPPPSDTKDAGSRRDHRRSAGDRIPRPRGARARWSGGALTVAIASRRFRTALSVSAEYVGEFGKVQRRVRRTRRADRLTIKLRRAPGRVVVRLVDQREFGRPASKPLILSRGRSGRYR
ncbi:MAG: S8 family serine peptidase, partial [Actinomycetes bacterium]